jgi:hypothetical protein
MKKLTFTSILERSDNRLWGCHLRVPNGVARQLIDHDSRRVVCTLNASVEYQCAILARGSNVFVITVNKKIRESLGLVFGMEVHVSLKKDDSKYGLPMPGELNELLKQDPESRTLFHALSRGKQRTLLHIIGSVKSSDKRVARAITVVKHLKMNGGKINYRQLYASMKDHRGWSGL